MVDGKSNPTMVEDATTMVIMKGLQLIPKVSGKVDVTSCDNLEAVMDSRLFGIMAAHRVIGCGTKQSANGALIMSGGYFNWDQSKAKLKKGKDKKILEAFDEDTNKLMEDIMVDSLDEMGPSGQFTSSERALGLLRPLLPMLLPLHVAWTYRFMSTSVRVSGDAFAFYGCFTTPISYCMAVVL
ncbi:hypothetical protein V6N11_052983 [Hibiscus sabdariffa]|uniref:Uncharacterized protein n=1 Tax=Hibiscus sabdariffa TaxID=183260 RepID=A0ABR2UBN2_9ROSI